MYTPYAHLSDNELILEVANSAAPTPLELELTERLHQLQENLNQIAGGARSNYQLPETKYKEIGI